MVGIVITTIISTTTAAAVVVASPVQFFFIMSSTCQPRTDISDGEDDVSDGVVAVTETQVIDGELTNFFDKVGSIATNNLTLNVPPFNNLKTMRSLANLLLICKMWMEPIS